MRPLLALAPIALVTAACGEPEERARDLTVIDLRAATGQAGLRTVGVAVDPGGTRYVLDEQAGLYRLDGATATLVLPLADFPVPDVAVTPPFTDLVALSPGRFAITAIGDGLVLDLGARTLTSYFCYVPDGLPEDYSQRTDAVAYDAVTDRIFAQPLTFDSAGTLLSSQLAEYLGDSGINVDWFPLDNAVHAGAMAVVPGRGLVIADGLQLIDFDGQRLAPDVDLGTLGLSAADGMAFDAARQSLLVVDDLHDVLTEIPLEQLYPRTI